MLRLVVLILFGLPLCVAAQIADDEFCAKLAAIEGTSEDEIDEYAKWSEEFVATFVKQIESEEFDGHEYFPDDWVRRGLRVLIASCYISGNGTFRDINKAMALLNDPAEAGYPNAVHILASLRLFNTDNPALQRLGFAAIEKEYEAGSGFSAGKLGWAYQEGRGVEPDQERAVELYEYAAKHGMTYWQYLLAHAYEKGYLGLDVDGERSEYWLEFKPKIHVALYECWVATYYADGTFPEEEDLRAKYQKICAETDLADVWEWQSSETVRGQDE